MKRDSDLVRESLAGDVTARAELASRHAGPLRATTLAILGPTAEVDDIVQECLLRGFEQLETVRDPESVGAWLRGICRNICRDTIRSRNRWVELREAENVEHPRPETRDLSSLRSAVHQLPTKLREVILLFYMESATYDDIARRLEITAAAVNRRLTRARALLRDRLRAEEGVA